MDGTDGEAAAFPPAPPAHPPGGTEAELGVIPEAPGPDDCVGAPGWVPSIDDATTQSAVPQP